MIISNNHRKLNIKLSTNSTETLSMTYKHIEISQITGLPVGSYTTHTVTPTTDADGNLVFSIYLNQYNVGDEVKDFTVSGDSSTVNLWDTHEGVNVLINGEIVDVMPVYNNSIETETIDGVTVKKQVEDLHRSKFAYNFQDDGDYTIQAVYRGNNATEMSYTDPLTLHIKQPSDDGGSTPTGNYKLEFVDKNLKTLTYDDQKRIEFRLTKGGVPVSGKTIEMPPPRTTGEPLSQVTNANGIVGYVNNDYTAGKYRIGARFIHQEEIENNKMVTSTYKDIEIKKATPTITHTASPVNLGTKLQIKVKTQYGSNFTDKKVIVYVNGSPKTTKTNDNGNVWVDFKKKGTYKIKVVSTETANNNMVTETFNFKVN